MRPRLASGSVSWPRLRRGAGSAWVVTAVLIAVVVAIRWPVAAGLTRDVPSDLGDPLFVAWALARASVHWTELLGRDAVVVHFPFGAPEHDLRYMFYSATHRTAMVNGSSSRFPPSWQAGLATLAFPMTDASATLRLMASRRVTHAMVHDDVWRDGTGAELRAMLATRGATLVFNDGPDAVVQLPPP